MFEPLVWVVPVVVAGLGLWRPRAGLLALAAALPLFGSPPGGPYLAALDVAGLAAILAALRAGRMRRSALTWPVAALVLVSLLSLVPLPYLPPAWRPGTLVGLLSALPGVESTTALYTWRAAVDLLLGCGLFLAVRRAFSGHPLRPLALALGAGAVAVMLLGLAAQNGLIDLAGYRPHHAAVNDASPRLYSLFFLSGWFSQYLVLAVPPAIGALVLGRRWQRYATLPLLALALACLALTQQRGAWVAAAAQLLFLAAITARHWLRWPGAWSRRLAAVLVTGVFAVVVAVGSGGSGRSFGERALSVGGGLSTRAPLWQAAVTMTRQRPLAGWGLGSFTPAYDLLHPPGSPDARSFRGAAHSLYLHTAAERGLLGLAGLALVGLAAALCLRRPRPGQEALAAALAVALVGAAVYGLVQYLFHLRNIGWLLWMLLGCVALVTRLERLPLVRRAAQGLVAVALLLVPFRLLAGDPPAYSGNHTYGLHESEAGQGDSHRWTEGVAAMRLPWAGETLVLELANGHPRANERPVTVSLAVDGRPLAQLTIAGGWEEHRFDLGPPRGEWIVLELEVRPTFRPFSDFRGYPELGRSRDIRSLGVAIRPPRWAAARHDVLGDPRALE